MGKKQQDAILLQNVASGDLTACRQLMDENLKRVLGLAYRLLGDVSEAEDVSQEAFLRLWKQSKNWRADAMVRVWLYRVVYNLCIDTLRKRGRLSDQEAPEEHEEAGQLETLHNGQVVERLNEVLFQLPERQRTAITLVHLQEEPQKEAAEVMGISVEALESLLSRGKRNLRGKLETQKHDLIGGIK